MEELKDIGNQEKDTVEVSSWTSKKYLLPIIIVVLLSVIFGWYAYYVGKNVTGDNATIIEKIESGIKKTVGVENNDINYSFYVKWNVEVIDNWDTTESGNFDIKEWKILSTHNGLQQRLQLWSVDVNINEEKKYSIKNLDIISKNERIYFFLEEWMNYYSELINEIQLPSQAYWNIEPIINSGSYVMIDNAKPLLKVFGKLTENDLMREFLIGLTTSNPQAYYASNGTDKKLSEYLSSDEMLNYIFTEWETNTVTGKTPLSINSGICKDYAPVVLAFMNDFYSSAGIDMGAMSAEEMVPVCEQQIVAVNTYLPMMLQISKEGDIVNWNYSFVMAQWNMLNVKVKYTNHLLDNWYTSIQDPMQQFSWTINGDKEWIISSVVKVAIDTPQWSLSGSIIDGTWKIIIEGEQENAYKVSGIIEFKDYIISNYDIIWYMDQFWTTVDLSAKWNIKAGNIKFIAKQWEEEILIFILKYTWLEHNLEYFVDNLSVTSVLKENKYDFVYKEDINSGRKEEILFTYDSWKITWSIKDNYTDTSLKWEVNSYNNFDIYIIENKNNGEDIHFTGSGNIETKLQYVFEVIQGDEKEVEIISTINKENKNWMTLYNVWIEWGKLNQDWIEEGVKVDFTIGYKEWGAEYMIPESIQELDISVMEMMTLPNISSLKSMEMNKQTYIIAWVTGWAVLGTVAFISLQWYSQEAKNSKIYSDLANLSKAVEISNTPLKSMVIENDEYLGNNVIVWDKVLTSGENYFVGTINFAALNQNWDDFKAPDGSDYIIWVVVYKHIAKFQVMGKIQNPDGSYKTAVKWSYYQANDWDSKWLIYINNQPVVNNEIIY